MKTRVSAKKLFTLISGILLVGLLVVFCFSSLSSRTEMGVLENQKAELAQQYEEQIKVNKELQAVLDSDDKDSYIEAKAREKGYVKSNEIVFYDISASE